MKQIYIDSFLLHSNTGPAGTWIKPKIAGIGFPSVRGTASDRSGEHGGDMPKVLYGARRIVLNGKVQSNQVGSYEANRIALGNAMALDEDADGETLTKLLKFTTLTDKAVQIEAKLKDFRMDWENPTNADFMIDLYCEWPFFEAQNAEVFTVSRPTGGGTLLPFIVPVILGAEVGGTIVITNNGNAQAYPKMSFIGPLNNPIIQNITTGQFLQINVTVAAGQVVTIDMKEESILLGTQSLLQYKASVSNFWALAKGANIIKFTTTSAGDTGYAQIEKRDTWVTL